MFSSITAPDTTIPECLPLDLIEPDECTVTMGFTISVTMDEHEALASQIEAFLQSHPNWDFNAVMTEALRLFFASQDKRSWTDQIEYNETDGGAV